MSGSGEFDPREGYVFALLVALALAAWFVGSLLCM